MALVFLFGAMLIVMLIRVAPPIGVRIAGEPIGRVTLSFGERVRLHRTSIYAIGAVLLLVAVTQSPPLLLELVVIAGVLAILCIPIRYVFTSDGVAMNRSVFRHWSDFDGYDVGSAGITLVPRARMGRFRLILGPAKRDEVARSLRRFLAPRDAKVRRRGPTEASPRRRGFLPDPAIRR